MVEGSIKYGGKWTREKLEHIVNFKELNLWRQTLYDNDLIGIEDGIISVRNPGTNNFYISGSGTGGLKRLKTRHYAIVTGIDFEKGYLDSKGLTKASSEALTHAAFYETRQDINAVLHAHNEDVWKAQIDNVPTTAKDVEYGTPEMAEEIRKILKDCREKKGIIVMGGHKDGILTYDSTLNGAGTTMLLYSLHATIH